MSVSILSQLLLLENTSILKLYQEIIQIANYFVLPCFLIALILEYFSDYNFGEVIKKLLLIVMFMSFFYQFHTEGSKIALQAASDLLTKVSPNNLFIKKLSDIKIKTKEKPNSFNLIDKFIVPNLNDFVATLFYVLGKVFLWLLKLIYSTVYHLTYVFSGVSAILYFFSWTKGSLKGSIQASLWCMLLPFVVVSILCLVGNSFEERTSQGDFLVSSIDSIVWLFGITLLLLISPLIAYGIIQGDGPAATGAKVGTLLAQGATKGIFLATTLQNTLSRATRVNPISSAIPRSLGNIFRRPNTKQNFKSNNGKNSNYDNYKKNGASRNNNQGSNLENEQLHHKSGSLTSSKETSSIASQNKQPTQLNQIKHSTNEGVNNVKAATKNAQGDNRAENRAEKRSEGINNANERSNRSNAFINRNKPSSTSRESINFEDGRNASKPSKEIRPQTTRTTDIKPRRF